jgi:hypothetical protein
MAERMRTAVAVVLACLAVLSSACTWGSQAKKRSGASVVVQQTGGAEIKGELVGVRSEGLVLGTKKGAATIPISEVKSLWTVKKMSNEGRTALALGGLIGGTALGVGVGRAATKNSSDWGDAIGVGSLCIFGGMLVGEGVAVLIATRTKKGSVYDFKNKSPEEVELILTDLRKLARVPDYR